MSTLDEIYARQDRWDTALRRAEAREAAAKRRQRQALNHLGVSKMVNEIATALQPCSPSTR